MMHDKWSMFTVYQMEQYLNSVTNSESPVTFDSRELFSLLDEVKHSKSEGVQGHVVTCLALMLNTSRNMVLVKYIADELQSLFKLTTHEAIALDVLKQIQKLYKLSKTCIKVEELMDNVYSKIKTFGCNNEEFLKYCDYDVEEKNEEKFEETKSKSGHDDEEASSRSPPRGVTLKLPRGTTLPSSPLPSGRMGISRVIELLQSEDSNCRSFALEKLSKCTAQQQLEVEEEEDEDGDDSMSLSNRRSRQQDAQHTSKETLRTDIHGCEEADDLLRALFTCLKKSIKPPGEILAKTATKVRQPLAFLIADKALHSSDSCFSAIFLCIKCIHWIVKEWTHDSCIGIISEKWRILLTLAHASDRQDDDLEIAEKCGELLILLTNMHGWKKYNIRLEKDSITYFLGSEHPLMRTILALSFVRGNFNFEALKNQPRAHQDSEVITNDFANLRSIWRWSIGNYSQNVCIQALEVLSSALVLSEVKSHLTKYNPLEKVLLINLPTFSCDTFKLFNVVQ
jgi:hypothetical protein